MSFRPLFIGLNHIFHLKNKVAFNVKINFLTLFHVTLKKHELQKSNLHQLNHLKVYFLAYFMQNSQKLNMVGYTASNMWPKRYGGPCRYGL